MQSIAANCAMKNDETAYLRERRKSTKDRDDISLDHRKFLAVHMKWCYIHCYAVEQLSSGRRWNRTREMLLKDMKEVYVEFLLRSGYYCNISIRLRVNLL